MGAQRAPQQKPLSNKATKRPQILLSAATRTLGHGKSKSLKVDSNGRIKAPSGITLKGHSLSKARAANTEYRLSPRNMVQNFDLIRKKE